MIPKRTVGIVGAGHVGVAAAYALFMQRIATEIILVDKDTRRTEGEAMDLMHAQALVGRVVVRAGSYADLAEAAVVVVAAGVNQRPGETRADLIGRNAVVFREIAHALDEHAPDAIVLIATNPVDTLTDVMHRLSHRDERRIVGTGTWLDTARFRALLGGTFGVSPRSVHAYILGEHGDSEVPLWSSASVGGAPIALAASGSVHGRALSEGEKCALFEQARGAAYAIIERKGYTDLAIGIVIGQLVDAFLSDERAVVPVSVHLNGEYGIEGMCMSIPCVLGAAGVVGRVVPDVDASELAALRDSAKLLRARLADTGIEKST